MTPDPYDALAAAACACCRAEIRLRHVRALVGLGLHEGQQELRSVKQAAHCARERHLRLRRELVGC